MKKIIVFLTKHKLLFIALGIMVLIHISYINSGYVWVDHNDFEEHQAIVPMNELYRVFTSPFGQTDFYRPLVTILNSVDYSLYGDWPVGYHITNLLLHLAVVFVAGLFLKTFLNLSDYQTFLARVFIGVHPMSILIVGALTRRQESLTACMIFLCLVFYMHARRSNKLPYQILTGIVFFLALLAKETAIVIVPSLMVLWELTREKRGVGKGIRVWIISTIVLLSYAFLRFNAVPSVWNTKGITVPLSQYIGIRINLAAKWIEYALSPFKPNFTDAVPILAITNGRVLISIVLFAILTFTFFRSGYKSKLGKTLLLIGILIAPGLDIVPVPRIGIANYGYLPVIGMAGLFVLLLEHPKTKIWGERILIIWIAFSSVTTFLNGSHFENDKTFFEPEVQGKIYFPEAHYFLGNYYRKNGDQEEAYNHYKIALQKDDAYLAYSDSDSIKINLAGVALENGELDFAKDLYSDALPHAPESQKEYIEFNLILISYERGEYQNVVEMIQKHEWKIPDAYLMLAYSFDKLGNTVEGAKALEKALSLVPDDQKVQVMESFKTQQQ